LEKAFHQLFPERVVRIYKDRESMQRAFERAEFAYLPESVLPDPALKQHSAQNSISLWRPFLGDAEHSDISADILLPILPFSWITEPKILLLEKAVSKLFPPSDLLSAVISSLVLSSVYSLMQQMSSETSNYATLIQNLSETSWQHKGMYLSKKNITDDSTYEKMFIRFLDEGFLIPPKKNLPIILPIKPNSLSQGELAKLTALLIEFGVKNETEFFPLVI
jgi:hypothetical protein